MTKKRIKANKGAIFGRWFIRILLILWSVCVIFPLIWVFYTSLKSNMEFFADPWALPAVPQWGNYVSAWATSNFSGYYLNSLFTVLGTLILTLIFSSTTAYILAKYTFKGVRLAEKFYMIAMVIPSVLLLVPLFFQCLNWKMTDNLWTLIFLYALQSLPFSVFILTGFMRGVNNSLLEAAAIDGASEFTIFFRIMIPCVKPSLFVVALMNLMGTWNEYVMALTFLSDPAKYTVPIGISYLSSASSYSVDYGGLFAGLILAMIPILIIYSFFQRQLQEGMASNDGVKG